MSAAQQRRVLHRPAPGFYLLRLVPHAWQVGVKIVEQDGAYSTIINGEPSAVSWTEEELEAEAVRAIATGTLFDHEMFRIVLFGVATDEAVYDHRLAMKEWAEKHNPQHPAANPRKPMDARLLPAEDF